jgi:hypothetical protein
MLHVMEPGKWMSMTQVDGGLALHIAPECAARAYQLQYLYKEDASPAIPLEMQAQKGLRKLVSAWSCDHRKHGRIIKSRKEKDGREPYYRLTKKGIKHREKTLN